MRTIRTGEEIAHAIMMAYWPRTSFNDPADRKSGDSYIKALTIGEVEAVLDFFGPPDKGGRGPTYCMFAEVLGSMFDKIRQSLGLPRNHLVDKESACLSD